MKVEMGMTTTTTMMLGNLEMYKIAILLEFFNFPKKKFSSSLPSHHLEKAREENKEMRKISQFHAAKLHCIAAGVRNGTNSSIHRVEKQQFPFHYVGS